MNVDNIKISLEISISKYFADPTESSARNLSKCIAGQSRMKSCGTNWTKFFGCTKSMILLPLINRNANTGHRKSFDICRWIFLFDGHTRNQILANEFSEACAWNAQHYSMTNSIVQFPLSIHFHVSEAFANILIAWMLCEVCRAVCTQWYYDNELQAQPVLCQYFASSTYYLVD